MESSLSNLLLITLSAIIFIVVLLTGIVSKRSFLRKIGKIGLAGSVLFALVPIIQLSKFDWRIPECRDENGVLIQEDNGKCKFP